MTRGRARPSVRRDINNLNGLRVGLYCRVSRDNGGEEKSVDDQEAVGRAWVAEKGAVVADTYRDANRSASRFAKKAREEFNRLLGDIKAGNLDAVWFWELTRSQRRLGVFAELRDLCRDLGVLWVIKDRVYDPADYRDMMTLGMLSVVGENESEMTSERVLRGQKATATAGKPGSFPPYGYRRVYDPVTRKLIRQEADFGDGTAVEDSPASVVREIFAKFIAGKGLARIAYDLNARGVPTFYGTRRTDGRPAAVGRSTDPPRWWPITIRQILRNHSYIGRRIFRGEPLEGVAATWPPLVDEETFWTAQQIMDSDERQTARPSRATHLLSFIARCECRERLSRIIYRARKRPGSPVRYNYTCTGFRCFTSIKQETLDDYVERIIVGWLSDPDVFTHLTAVPDDSGTAARTELAQLRAELEECRALAEAREMSPVLAARMEKSLLQRIADAEGRAQTATLPPVLVGNIGPEAAKRWSGLDMAIKRQIIAAVADIELRKIGKGKRNVPLTERVEFTWLLGPAAGEPRTSR